MHLGLIARLAAAVLTTALSASAAAADWPQWRGPDGTGVSGAKGVPIVWHEQRAIAWKCTLPGSGNSTPAIWGNAIFVTAHTADDKLLLLRINKKNGEIDWTQEVGRGTAGPTREAGAPGPKRHPQKAHKF